MKLNLEVELDWIDEELNIDETIKQNIIDSVVNKIQSKIELSVEGKINKIIDKIVISKINTMTEKVFNGFMKREITISDSYGSKIKVYPTIEALIKERFDNFMTQMVDEKGNTSESNYGSKYKRINFIIDEQLKSFANKFTTDAVKTVSDEIKQHVKDGLTTKLGAELMKVLKVNEMLQLPAK
jgi:ribosome-associated toxin RatA of RatAB toxin-antitoxin module